MVKGTGLCHATLLDQGVMSDVRGRDHPGLDP